MRIACLQFAPVVGDVDNNIKRADRILRKARPKDLDLLVLPEMAFSGYNFTSLHHISPYLEPTENGITALWARTKALKYDCCVVAGYPETVDVTERWPASPEYYNSAVIVNNDGETIANYRKSHLYYTDETWALEGEDGFYDGEIDGLGYCALGICMDLNPYKFEAPWSAWEFAYHILHRQTNLVILTMAWNTREEPVNYNSHPAEPDMETLSYWLARLEPVIRADEEEEIIVVFANRTGIEDNAVYAGTSAVVGILDGEVKVYGVLGRGQKELLVVDTSEKPQSKLVTDFRASNARSQLDLDAIEEQSSFYEEKPPEIRELLAKVENIESILAGVQPVTSTTADEAHSYFGTELEVDESEPLRSSVAERYSNTPLSDLAYECSTPIRVSGDNRFRSTKLKASNLVKNFSSELDFSTSASSAAYEVSNADTGGERLKEPVREQVSADDDPEPRSTSISSARPRSMAW